MSELRSNLSRVAEILGRPPEQREKIHATIREIWAEDPDSRDWWCGVFVLASVIYLLGIGGLVRVMETLVSPTGGWIPTVLDVVRNLRDRIGNLWQRLTDQINFLFGAVATVEEEPDDAST